MPRKREYEDDAARARAWRTRQEREHLQAAEIARQAERLHHVMTKAAAKGDSEAAALIGLSVAETLRNIRKKFEQAKPPES